MHLFLVNNSRQEVLYRIDQGEFHLLAPMGQVSVDCQASGSMKLTLKHNYESSYTEERGSQIRYHLVINSVYRYEHLAEWEELQITNEINPVQEQVVYDRFFVGGENAILVSEDHWISGEDRIDNVEKKRKQGLIRSKFFEWFVVKPLIQGFLLSGIYILLGIVIGFLYGWKFAGFYFLIFYILMILSNVLEDGFDKQFDRVLLGKKSSNFQNMSITELMSNDCIKNYYLSLKETANQDTLGNDSLQGQMKAFISRMVTLAIRFSCVIGVIMIFGSFGMVKSAQGTSGVTKNSINHVEGTIESVDTSLSLKFIDLVMADGSDYEILILDALVIPKDRLTELEGQRVNLWIDKNESVLQVEANNKKYMNFNKSLAEQKVVDKINFIGGIIVGGVGVVITIISFALLHVLKKRKLREFQPKHK